jgi:ABC-type uncharacterized transport system permease subunit
MTAFTFSCATLYLLTAWRLGTRVIVRRDDQQMDRPASTGVLLALGLLALGLHAAALYDGTVAADGLRLGIFNAISLIGWTIAALVLFAVHGKPLDNLGVFVLPLSAISVLLAWLFPSNHETGASFGVGLQVHVLVSIVAYGLLALAALQALLVAVQDRWLRDKRSMARLRALPPLARQENLLFQLIGTGFFFLSLALVSGAMFVQDLVAQHLVHKTVLSGIAWLVFGTILCGRWRYGWRGQPVIRWCLVAFVLLALAYFGAKLVLEEILGRSWSG